jgi:hypothetical protein
MAADARSADLAAIATRFRLFAEKEAAGYSPLYERLALAVADDDELLALASHAPPGQPYPNMLLAAVHYLLLRGARHPLRRLYPSLEPAGGVREPAAGSEDPFPAFRDFCLAHASEIAALLATRRVQTNEVGRSACLLPAFNHVASISNAALALIEIGASAGLNLLCDRYHYDYGDLGTAGDPAAGVRLRCEVGGGNRPPVEAVPAIAFRAGCDVNVIDVTDADERLWLRALVWPEHAERAANLEAAMEVARSAPPLLLEGDGVELLPSLLEMAPADLTVCIFHSFVFNQMPAERIARFYEILAEQARKCPIFDLSFEHRPGTLGNPTIEMARCVRGEWRRAVLARCHPHGSSMEWLL